MNALGLCQNPEHTKLDHEQTPKCVAWQVSGLNFGSVTDPKDLYVELLIASLIGVLDEDPSIDPMGDERKFNLVRRLRGLDWPATALSMIGGVRLSHLANAVETVLREGVVGDLIELGVWRGGACILMRGVLKAYGLTHRKVFVADSFAGLPPPRHAADLNDQHFKYKELAVSLDQVKKNFERYRLLDQQVIFLKGWFDESLPVAPISKLAILRLDGDMYESTLEGLTHLYPKLSQGGFCIVDDYILPACKLAVDRYRAENLITDTIMPIDGIGVFWRKNT